MSGGAIGVAPVAPADPRHSDDRAVLERFVAGDPDAVRLLYRRYRGPVYAVAMSLLHERDQAVEVVQETFVSAWRGAARFDPGRPFAPWLFCIARRSAIDALRRAGRRPVCIDAPAAGQGSEDAGMEGVWEIWEVRAAVDRLPVRERQVVAMTYYLGLTQAEIAAELDLPLGTVKSRTFRAQRRLASWLDHLSPGVP